MDQQGWQAAKGIFYEALERDPNDRETFLAGIDPDVRQEVETLLAAHERAQQKEAASPVKADGPGSTIGRYKLLQEIGEGGFGVVYLAQQQEPVSRRVALKIIKIGMDTKQVIARFEAERQALAILDHPNIAKVLDAGATDTGRPYFVMELVKGIPITEYCDQASLETKDRLKLFTGVCRAIQHAHQKGIIHRDLKPGNVLVTLHDGTPVPKVIDFGIAKATDRHLTEKTLFTEFRQIVGTPEYMAPEQAAYSGLDVDTRADVYSLGVLLYELLTGSKPFEITSMMEQGWGEILRVIREEDPPRPSTKLSTMGDDLAAVAKSRHTEPRLLGRLVKGDLDWIVMKALEKDRTRRYDTADAFAQDVERFLGDLPVNATPPSTTYRMRKYVKRHKVGVVAAAAVAVALIAGFVASTMGFVEARTQRAEAIVERDGADRARAAEVEARSAAETAATAMTRERDEKEAARVQLASALERAEGTRLLAQSQVELRRDPSLALLLAVEGAERSPGLQANQALIAALGKAPPREVALEGGDCPVAEFDPRGGRLATGHEDGSVRIWDVRTTQPLHVLRLCDRQVIALSWNADRDHVVAVAECGTIGIWDATSGERLIDTEGEPGGRNPLGFNSCYLCRGGSRVVQVWWPDEVEVFEPYESEFPSTFSMRELDNVREMAVSRDGRLLLGVVRRNDHRTEAEVVLFDIESRKTRHTWPVVRPHPMPKFAPGGKQVLIAVGDGESRLYDAETGDEIRGFRPAERPHSYAISDHGFSGDGQRLWSTDGHHLWVWAVGSARLLTEIKEVPHTYSVNLSTHGERLAFVARGDTYDVKVFCVATGRSLWSMATDTATNLVRIDPTGRYVVAGGWRRGAVLWTVGRDPLAMWGQAGNKLIPIGTQARFWVNAQVGATTPPRIWDLETRRPVRHLDDQRGMTEGIRDTWYAVGAVGASPDGARIVTAGQWGSLTLWDGTTGRRLRSWRGHDGPIWHIEFSADGERFLSSAQDDTARAWEAATGAPLGVLGEAQDFWKGDNLVVTIGGRWARYSPQGDRVLTRLGEDDGIQVWDASTAECVLRVTDYEGRVIGAGFTADGRHIVSTTRELPNTLRAWVHDSRSGELLHQFDGCGPLGDGRGCSDARGKHVLVCVEGVGVELHDVDTGRAVKTFPFEGEALLGASYGPGDHHVVARTYSGNRMVAWDVSSAAVILDESCAAGVGGTVPFHPDGRHVIARVTGGYTLLPLDPLPLARSRRPRSLTVSERERFGIPATETAPASPPAPDGYMTWPQEDAWVEKLRSMTHPLLDDPEASDSAELVLRARLRTVGIPEVALLLTLESLGEQADDDLAWERAELLHRVAYEYARKVLGAENPTTDWALRRYATALTRCGMPGEAEPLWRDLIARWRVLHDERLLGRPLNSLGASVLAQGRLEQAEEFLREAVRVNLLYYGPDREHTLESKSLLGACLAARGETEEAEPLLVDAAERMRPWPGNLSLTVDALVRVVDFYEAEGKSDEADKWRARARPEAREKLGWSLAEIPGPDADAQ